ncbi:membrane glycosyltransferase [Orbus hercynius]|uniref:Glucans biosynthesis glucosyltransferase H n=1 Tax=Orbus hercynius TaxID=593135 RepID=A0A495RJ58_9GAMM|nr:glucans biosynthesis glucosyltransferase MdoH [Orbus hercynius]RKS87485.1 membrane glycosyltransferase [Orbus hercynius]
MQNTPTSDNEFVQTINQKWQNLLHCTSFNAPRKQIESMPKMKRQAIRPHYWDKANRQITRKLPFELMVFIRRFLLLLLIIGQTLIGSSYLSSLLPYQGWAEVNFINDWQINPSLAIGNITPYLLQAVIITLFAILFAWISIGFWTAIMGIWVTICRGDKYTLKMPKEPEKSINKSHRTALVMPICNEDVARVFAGLKATWQSLNQTGQLDLCDFYVLSDTNSADIYANELKAWADLVDDINQPNSVFYRHRERRVKRKSGNIDDFCRRFGNQYEYMIILDADSVMTGKCIIDLIAMMELTPNAGIIQSPPKTIRMRTLYGRIQQFANQTYSDIFCSGVHYWQLKEAQYWGHNAIIRLKPFMKHCILTPFTKGKQAIHIMSHDLVEASLMGRAGWQVMIAYDLSGSYEEVPANIIEDLKRDNRWCMGNLINLNVLFKPGIRFIHRVMFATSAMAYLSSLLWLLFLVFSTLLLLIFNTYEPQYFLHSNQLYPVWPRWDEVLAIKLLGATFTLLLAPKLVSFIIVLIKTGPKSVGGVIPFAFSIILEVLFSMILAPIRMIFHSKFVIKALLGSKIQWRSPARNDDALTWREAVYFCWPLTLIGAVWLYIVLTLNPQFTTWFIAILVPLIISPLVVKYSSLTSIGMVMKKAKLFLTKEETHPNQAIIDTDLNLAKTQMNMIEDGFSAALTKPEINALVILLSTHRHLNNEKQKAYREQCIERYHGDSLANLADDRKLKLMADPEIFAKLSLK